MNCPDHTLLGVVWLVGSVVSLGWALGCLFWHHVPGESWVPRGDEIALVIGATLLGPVTLLVIAAVTYLMMDDKETHGPSAP